MKAKKILLATLVAAVAFTPLMSVFVNGRGYWTYYEYTTNIGVGDGWNSNSIHPNAEGAYAVIVSSTGDCTLAYEWHKPVLDVCISNDDTHTITVTWR
jgi:hypothetical protein